MKNSLCLLLFILLPCLAFRADKPAYRIFKQNGKEASYQKMLRDLGKADIVLFGELHNNPISHWLELQLTKDLHRLKPGQLALGAEMFEADDQTLLNKYLKEQISGKELASQAKVWPNFTTDYKPLLDFAQTNQLPFIATNVPRRYASSVARSGLAVLDTLKAEEHQWMPPLPIAVDLNLPGYQSMINMMNDEHGGHGGIKPENLAKAQALKDATMAYFIQQNRQPGQLFLHFNGSYHSNNFEGIVWYLRQMQPDLKIATLSTAEQDDLLRLQPDNRNLANYIIVVPTDMTKTY